MSATDLEPREKWIQTRILSHLEVKGYMFLNRKQSPTDINLLLSDKNKSFSGFYWRNNTGASGYEDVNGKKRLVRYGVPGMSDVLGCTKDGRFFAIEIKRPGKKPTDKQQLFIDVVNASGGIAFVATCIEDLDNRGI